MIWLAVWGLSALIVVYCCHTAPILYEEDMTEKQVREAIKLYREGWGVVSIRRITGVPEDTLTDMLRGKTWTKITGGRIMDGKRPASELQIYKDYSKGKI